MFEVEAILGDRTKNKKLEYLIKWKGYDSKDNSWEPRASLHECNDLLDAYISARKQQVPKDSPKTPARESPHPSRSPIREIHPASPLTPATPKPSPAIPALKPPITPAPKPPIIPAPSADGEVFKLSSLSSPPRAAAWSNKAAAAAAARQKLQAELDAKAAAEARAKEPPEDPAVVEARVRAAAEAKAKAAEARRAAAAAKAAEQKAAKEARETARALNAERQRALLEAELNKQKNSMVNNNNDNNDSSMNEELDDDNCSIITHVPTSTTSTPSSSPSRTSANENNNHNDANKTNSSSSKHNNNNSNNKDRRKRLTALAARASTSVDEDERNSIKWKKRKKEEQLTPHKPNGSSDRLRRELETTMNDSPSKSNNKPDTQRRTRCTKPKSEPPPTTPTTSSRRSRSASSHPSNTPTLTSNRSNSSSPLSSPQSSPNSSPNSPSFPALKISTPTFVPLPPTLNGTSDPTCFNLCSCACPSSSTSSTALSSTASGSNIISVLSSVSSSSSELADSFLSSSASSSSTSSSHEDAASLENAYSNNNTTIATATSPSTKSKKNRTVLSGVSSAFILEAPRRAKPSPKQSATRGATLNGRTGLKHEISSPSFSAEGEEPLSSSSSPSFSSPTTTSSSAISTSTSSSSPLSSSQPPLFSLDTHREIDTEDTDTDKEPGIIKSEANSSAPSTPLSPEQEQLLQQDNSSFMGVPLRDRKKRIRRRGVSTGRAAKRKRNPKVQVQNDTLIESFPFVESAPTFLVFKQAYYPPDGFHGYMGPPEKFSVGEYATVEEANLGVRSTFLEDNPWGWSPEQVESGEIDIINTLSPEGFLSMRMQQADSEVWEVFAEPKPQNNKITLKLTRAKAL